MFDINPTGRALTRLGSTAIAAVETLQSVDGLSVVSGKVQVMIFPKNVGRLGGISTKPRGQYILASAVAGRVSPERLRNLGFCYKVEKKGHRYWFRTGHTDFRNFFVALEELTGLAI